MALLDVREAMVARAAWPDGLTRQPWEHQLAAYDRLGSLWYDGQRGTALFSGMGTGKSLVAIALWKAFGFRRVLIISGAKAMVNEWPDMIDAETGGEFSGVGLSGPIKERAAWLRIVLPTIARPIAVVTNVEAFWQGAFGLAIEAVPWDCIIVDESQKLKGAGSKASRFAYLLAKQREPYRIIMTGTPLHDKPVDIYGQYRFTDARIFGTNYESFLTRYTIRKAITQHAYKIIGYQHEDELRDKINSISFSVEDDVISLPPIFEPKHREVDLNPEARRVYRNIDKDLVHDFGDEFGTTIAGSELSAYTRLHQITSGFLPAVTLDGVEHVMRLGNDRQDALRELFAEINPAEPVVVFAEFAFDLARIKEVAQEFDRRYYEQSGRADQWRAFRASTGNDVIGVQYQAGGAGIDLTRSRYGIYYSHGYSYGDKRQTRKRLHRPGQTRSTILYHIVVRKTVDRNILRSMAEKRDVDRRIRTSVDD